MSAEKPSSSEHHGVGLRVKQTCKAHQQNLKCSSLKSMNHWKTCTQSTTLGQYILQINEISLALWLLLLSSVLPSLYQLLKIVVETRIAKYPCSGIGCVDVSYTIRRRNNYQLSSWNKSEMIVDRYQQASQSNPHTVWLCMLTIRRNVWKLSTSILREQKKNKKRWK